MIGVRRLRPLLVVLLAVAALIVACTAGEPSSEAAAAPPAQPVTITGLDLHDGTILKDGATYYLYGTMYGCGFQWGQRSPWCGFGVSTATALTGPWSPPTRLVSPSDVAPTGSTWQKICGDSGAGCFNPRMIKRSGWGANDGAFVLWFNAPDDWNRTRANAYWTMGCNGPAGPCGVKAGPPFGSTAKPSMWSCYDNGDFTLVPDPPRPPMMLCTMGDQTLGSERLSMWGASGTQGSGAHNLARAGATEAPGAYRDPATGTWILTFNEPNCGYCGGTPTSYATASSVDGAWSSPANPNTAWGAQPIGRRGISATSCGGQGRTVTVLDGQAYELIDLWLGTRNEAAAGLHLEPLNYHGQAPLGQPLRAFDAWTC